MKPVYFIAEVGKGCNGDLTYCEKILNKCKKAGAHAVRFHHFSLEESVYADALQKQTERAWSLKLKLPFIGETLFSPDDYKTILKWCRRLDLDFVATPWDLKSLKLFQSAGVLHFKVNSINLMNIPLVQVILEIAEKVYLSTGGMAEREIEQFCQKMNLSACDAVLMHAALAYPAPANILNLRSIEILQKYHPKVGYASNDLTKTAILTACSLGATVIEKHVHLEGETNEMHRASVDVSKFAEEIENVREMHELTARRIKQESRGEMVNQELLSKGMVLKENLVAGAVFSEQNLALQLPPKGVHAKSWFQVMGKRANKSLEKGKYLYSADIDGFVKKTRSREKTSYIPGKRGVVVRFKDIDEMIEGRQVDFVEVHYAASDLKQADVCKNYDLDLVVHLPEYADGKLLDLSTRDKGLRQFSIEVIGQVMERARKLQPRFKRSEGPLKFVLHAGGLTYPKRDPNSAELNEIFLDSLKQMDASGLEVLLENMTPFAWFLDADWSPKQGTSNNFLDAHEIADFCKQHGYNMCLDVCHAKLYCNSMRKDLYSYMKTVKPYVKHLHFSDCYGVDGEGLQVGEGENDWQDICEVFHDFEYGWTPEIWNGHLDHGEKFYEAHDLLSREFEKYLQKKNKTPSRELVGA